jgi:hypothetical protein
MIRLILYASYYITNAKPHSATQTVASLYLENDKEELHSSYSIAVTSSIHYLFRLQPIRLG